MVRAAASIGALALASQMADVGAASVLGPAQHVAPPAAQAGLDKADLAQMDTGPVLRAGRAQAAPYAACFEASARRWSIDERLLRALAWVESRYDTSAIHRNANGTVDIGVMQINSTHLQALGRRGINGYHLIHWPCTNIDIGAQILAGFIGQQGATWRAVGSYAVGSGLGKDTLRREYVGKVQAALLRAQSPPARPRVLATAERELSTQVPARMQVLE